MLLGNYYKALAAHIFNGNVAGAKNYDGGAKTIVRTTNSSNYNYFSTQTIAFDRVENVLTSRPTNAPTAGVIFGTGTIPATLDDYNLSGDVITAISANAAKTVEADSDSVTMETLYTITNTGTEAITIGEIAYCAYLFTSASNGFGAMLERTVLETPITIEPGGVGQVTYTIRMNYPTA